MSIGKQLRNLNIKKFAIKVLVAKGVAFNLFLNFTNLLKIKIIKN